MVYREFTIIPMNLNTSSATFQKAINNIDVQFPLLQVNKIDLIGGVATVKIPEEQAGNVKTILGDQFILSPNSHLKIIA